MAKRARFKRITEIEAAEIYTVENPLLEGEIVYVVDSLGTLIGLKQGRATPASWANVPLTIFGGTAPKQTQIITFEQISSPAVDDVIELEAVSNSGLAPITFSLQQELEIAALAGNTLTLYAPGTIILTAAQAGDSNYNATTATITLVINKATQTINFNEQPSLILLGGIQLNALATSELTVTYESDNEAVITVTPEGIVTAVGVGTAIITATQLGNDNYQAATPVSRTITVLE